MEEATLHRMDNKMARADHYSIESTMAEVGVVVEEDEEVSHKTAAHAKTQTKQWQTSHNKVMQPLRWMLLRNRKDQLATTLQVQSVISTSDVLTRHVHMSISHPSHPKALLSI